MDVGDTVIGVMIGWSIAFLVMLIVSVTGSNACVEATGADKCVKEWRAAE